MYMWMLIVFDEVGFGVGFVVFFVLFVFGVGVEGIWLDLVMVEMLVMMMLLVFMFVGVRCGFDI